MLTVPYEILSYISRETTGPDPSKHIQYFYLATISHILLLKIAVFPSLCERMTWRLISYILRRTKTF